MPSGDGTQIGGRPPEAIGLFLAGLLLATGATEAQGQPSGSTSTPGREGGTAVHGTPRPPDAADATPEDIVIAPEVTVEAERLVSASSVRTIPEEEILLQPQGRPADVLRLIPGFITLEHSGGAGKADQYIVRGFDADHGTDVAFHVDEMPINLRSHAHGQGYTDLNFIIPETIERIEGYKGPHYVRYGDFATAAAVNYATREVVPEGFVQGMGGDFNTQRYVAMGSPTKSPVRTLVAGEFYYTDGPFTNGNRNNRYNGLAKLTMNPTSRSQLDATLTGYYSRWNGSGQIPLRDVQAGRLDRFGSLDPSEGGNSTRATARLNYSHDLSPEGTAFARLWGQYYHLDLFTNFTFFLNDPVNGDGIEQNDRRWIYGGDVGYQRIGRLLGADTTGTIGVQVRVDDIQARLGTQRKREALAPTINSDILEASYAPYVNLDVLFTPKVRFVGGLRVDVFTFDVQDRCGTACTVNPQGKETDAIANPKGNLILGPWADTQVFLNMGTGFHSNDARAVVADSSLAALPRATGYEVGLFNESLGWATILANVWLLDLESELVLVGDEGTTEARGATRRYGTEASLILTPVDWLTFRGDVTYTKAEFKDTGDHVPLAPGLTGFATLLARFPIGLSANLQMITVGSRPANETNTVKLEPFTVFDLMLRQVLPLPMATGRLEAFFNIRNLTDTEWRQAQFLYASRLAGEPAAGVEDIHFVPGIPRSFFGGVTWYFD